MIGLGSSSTLGIGLIVSLRDNFSANANKIASSVNAMNGNVNKAMENTFGLMTGVGAGMAGMGYMIAKGMNSAVQSAMAFQDVMINIKALGQLSNDDMIKLSNVAQSLGPKYGMDAITIAKGFEDLVKAGMSAKDIPVVMEAMIQTSLGASEALEGTSGVAARMTDILMGWGFQARDAGRVGDILARAAVQSTVSFGDLAESMKYSQDILKSMNLTFEESVAMMAILGNSGIKASMSGTSLGNAWRQIAIALGSHPSKNQKGALAQLGLQREDLMDAHGGLLSSMVVLDKIKHGLIGMGSIQKQNVLNDLFGVRGKRGVNPLIDFLEKGPNDKFMGLSFKEMVNDLTNNSIGTNMRLVEEKMTSAEFQAKKLHANWENFKITLGNSLLPLLNRMLPIISKIVEGLTSFAKTGVGRTLTGLIATFGAILIPAGGLLVITGLLGKGLLSMTGGFATFRQAGLWAFNALIGRALTYAGIMQGVGSGMKFNSAGRLIDSTTGRFVAGGATSSAGTGIGGMITQLGSAITPVLGTIALFGIALYGVYKILDMMGFIDHVGTNTKPITQEDFVQRTQFNQQFGYKKGGEHMSSEDNRAYAPSAKTTTVNIHIDGKKAITKHIKDDAENESTTHFNLPY